MDRPVYVTGLGAVTAIGNNVTENMERLSSHQAGVGRIRYLNTIHQNSIVAAEVKLSNEELFADLSLLPDVRTSRTSLLGMKAVREAIASAGLTEEAVSSARTGFISATSVGGMDKFELYYGHIIGHDDKAPIQEVISHDCGNGTQEIADYIGIRGFITTISTACSSSANAIMLGARMIKAGLLDRVIAGGTDSLTKFTINGFNTLMILDREHCKPFDRDRKGLNLGEGAGFLVLEAADVATQKTPLALVTGYANANDAYHQTASSPDGEGNYRAMTGALNQAKIKPEDISYINVHGTGTENNDQAESMAMNRIFGSALPPFSSTKAFTGHTLGAAGGIEAVYSVMAIVRGCVYPNLNFNSPIEPFGYVPVTQFAGNSSIKNVLSNSFGFGGNCSSLIFSSPAL